MRPGKQMATTRELAKQYAEQIKYSTPVAKSKDAKIASDDSESFRRAVRNVLSDVDGLTYTTGQPISSEDRDTLLAELDKELGVSQGTMATVKKSSVQGAIAFANQLASLQQSVLAQGQAKK